MTANGSSETITDSNLSLLNKDRTRLLPAVSLYLKRQWIKNRLTDSSAVSCHHIWQAQCMTGTTKHVITNTGVAYCFVWSGVVEGWGLVYGV
jgi:hypothetical protein